MIIRDIMENSRKAYSDMPAIKWLVKKQIHEKTYGEMMNETEQIRRGLFASGFGGKHIAITGKSSVDWIESYLAIMTGNMVAVPLDVNLPAEDLIDLIDRSDSEGVFCLNDQKLIEAIKEACPKVRNIWLLDEKENKKSEIPDAGAGITISPLSELIRKGAAEGADAPAADPDDVATIIFTSGTTGKSKGVMLTQKNIAENVLSVHYEAAPGTRMLSVLPIHHAFCLVMDWLKGFSLGAELCINDSLLHLVRNMSVFNPDVILMVPMMIETIYKRLSAADASIPKEILAKKIFGENLRIIFTGGAHLEPFYIDEFAEYGIAVLEGYGMSECSPVISMNAPEDHKDGSIGRPLENVEIRFENDEILVRGSSVMQGYYQMPAETEETLKDGWLHTGDKGYMDEDGFLFINGRVKNLIILSNGENVSPEEIENKLALSPLVGEVIVTGEGTGLTARIYPEQALAEEMDEETVREELQKILDEYNRKQPTYRHITGLTVRKHPFIRSATKKILRRMADVDED
ncbi:MAG TPA: acyl-CoA thioester hydrolase [Lachnospiraceae bacterium]|nr:acyl-CoA thioester hydrolase [Lachnospiraceae bacterium]